MKHLLRLTVAGAVLVLLGLACEFSTIRQRVIRNIREETITVPAGDTLDNLYALHPKDTAHLWFDVSQSRPVSLIVQDSSRLASAPYNPSQAFFAALNVATDTGNFAVTGDTMLNFAFINTDTVLVNVLFHLDRIYWEAANP
jgi:hypothetical protein